MSRPVRFGDRVTLDDGRVGVVTFVDGTHMRFVKTWDSSQMWTWEPIASVSRIHRQVSPLATNRAVSDGA